VPREVVARGVAVHVGDRPRVCRISSGIAPAHGAASRPRAARIKSHKGHERLVSKMIRSPPVPVDGACDRGDVLRKRTGCLRWKPARYPYATQIAHVRDSLSAGHTSHMAAARTLAYNSRTKRASLRRRAFAPCFGPRGTDICTSEVSSVQSAPRPDHRARLRSVEARQRGPNAAPRRGTSRVWRPAAPGGGGGGLRRGIRGNLG
jgi:hypothetical protein